VKLNLAQQILYPLIWWGKMKEHIKTKINYTYKYRDVEIDVRLASSIKFLWEAGIHTVECCQGDETKKGYICFASSKSIEDFHKALYYLDFTPWLGENPDLDKRYPPIYIAMLNASWKIEPKTGGRILYIFEFEAERLELLNDLIKSAFGDKPIL
jgi:hypothetical protein